MRGKSSRSERDCAALSFGNAASKTRSNETFFAKLARTLLRGIRVDSKEELRERILAHLDWLNADPVVFKWGYGIEDLEAA